MTDRRIVVRARTPQDALAGVLPTAALGVLRLKADGWHFMPFVASHKASRVGKPTWQQALPRWTGGLDRTESREMLPGQTIPEALHNFAHAVA
jgi:hypothetical protein